MKAKKAWIAAIAVALIVGVGVFLTARAGKRPAPPYETIKVDRGRIVARVTATGTLSALVTVQVGSQVSGRIQQINVDFNSTVKKGDVIAKIDPDLFDAAVEQAKANYAAAKGNLEKAQAQAVDADRQFQRSKTLAERNLIATADRDTAESTAAAARAQVAASAGALEQARASLHQAQLNLDYSIIKSPIDGVVISRSVDVGQTVAASLQAPTLFTIAEDLKKMQVDTNVAEADVGKLQPEMTSTFTVDAYPQERFRGKVRQIRNAPQNVQNVITYDAVIDVENADLKLKPGMTANVTFIFAEKADALRVPNAALRFRPSSDLAKAAASASGLASSSGLPRAPSSAALVAAASASGPASGGDAPSSDAPGNGRKGQRRAPVDPDTKTVWRLDGPVPRPVTIKVGISDGSYTEVVEGELAAGDTLVTDVASGSDSSDKPTAPGGAPPGGLRRVF